MTIAKVYYTERRRIFFDHITVKIFGEDPQPPVFDFSVDLASYDFPDNAVVAVEAHSGTLGTIFPMGSVGEQVRLERVLLSDFDTWRGIQFRLTVTSVDGEKDGLLLGLAEQIKPTTPDLKDEHIPSILAVKQDPTMRHEIYCLDIDPPVLRVNPNTGMAWETIVKTPWFITLALPAILKDILSYILFVERVSDPDDADGWQRDWLTFAHRIPGVNDPVTEDDDQQKMDWIDSVCREFSKDNKMVKLFKQCVEMSERE
jgi:hypothetical protein